MTILHCSSDECGKPFQVNEFTTRMPIPYPFGVIKCPHCGAAHDGNPTSLFLTHALSVQEEQQFSRHVPPA